MIFSSQIIPGNEVAIGRIMNQLSDLGVRIVTDRQAHVHVSGHPGRPELVADVRLGAARDRRARSTARRATWPSRRGSRWRTGVPQAVVPEERRRRPPRARRAGEDRRGARRAAGARRRRDPAGRRRDDQRAAPDRLQRADHGRAADRRRRASSPARRWSGRSACRSRRTATISSPTRPTPRRAPSSPAATRTRCARRCGSRCAAARRCGRARSRWSK